MHQQARITASALLTTSQQADVGCMHHCRVCCTYQQPNKFSCTPPTLNMFSSSPLLMRFRSSWLLLTLLLPFALLLLAGALRSGSVIGERAVYSLTACAAVCAYTGCCPFNDCVSCTARVVDAACVQGVQARYLGDSSLLLQVLCAAASARAWGGTERYCSTHIQPVFNQQHVTASSHTCHACCCLRLLR